MSSDRGLWTRTGLSHLGLTRIGVRGHLRSVARPSQYAPWMLSLASLLATGCIVPDAPEYGSPTETPIFVQAASISPDPRSVLHIMNEPPNVLQVSFVVQSEDLPDDGIVSAIYVDYKHQGGQRIDHKGPLTAYTFDQPRTISWRVPLPISELPKVTDDDPVGCHIITVIVLHQKGWDEDNNQQIGTPPDLAAVSWLAAVNDENGAIPVDLSSCPDVSTTMSGTIQ